MRELNKLTLALITVAALTGCNTSTSPEEKMVSVCKSKLAIALEENAKYAGWDLSKIDADLASITENQAMALEHGQQDTFFKFTVNLKNFTVKNGFNADVVSTATCIGSINKFEGEFENIYPENYMYEIHVNGKKMRMPIDSK